MHRRVISIVSSLALVVPALVVLLAAPASAQVFSNPTSITLNDPNSQTTGQNNAIATPYPSTIAVSGLTGTVNHVAVTLSNVSYSHSQDIDVLLVGPGGQKFILVANLGPNSGTSAPASNSTLTLSDSGTLPTMLTPWGSGNTFKPVDFGGFNEVWVPPAPAAPYSSPGTTGTGATLGSVFNGTNPNGTWSLYVITTAGGDGTGAIAGGWSLDITTASVADTTTALSSNNNPSFTAGAGSSVTLTATVHKASDSSNVGEGTVAFTDGGTPISGCAAVAVSAGVATCTTSFTTEGNHAIQAQYGGTANFGPSNASLTQVVNNHTTVTGSNFCNTGSIALNNPPNTVADATPYPSNVFVSGLAGTVNHVAVTLNNVSYSHSQDLDALLVGPGGQTLILVANLGPNSGPGAAVANSTVTFSDAGVLPPSGATTPWGATPTFKPVNYGGFNEVWGPPAPAGPYGDPGTAGTGSTLASQFNGINGNGTWRLYVITTASGDGTGAIAGGWCANITSASAAAGSTTTLSSNNNPSFTTAPGNAVTFTATVKKTSDSSNINEGTVAFSDNGTSITGCTAVAVSAGVATCASSFSTQGSHPILAQYNGTANFGTSSASLSQVVNNHTVVTGNSYCNSGSITLNNPPSTVADATPYPSNIFASGLSTDLLHLTVTLNNVSYSHSQDIDALLVGPGGQTLILVANLGPNSGAQAAASNSTLTLDDAGILPPSGATTPWDATPTFKPVNYGGFNEVWGPPAPPGPYGDPGTAGTGATLGSVFNGTNPNGTWSLYVITTASGDGTGAIAGGWCVGLTVPQPPAITKAFGASSIPLNGSTTMTIGLTNPASNNFGLTGVGFTDTLPAGLVVSTPNGLSNTCGGTVTAVAGSNTVSLSGGTIAQAGNCALSVNVTGTSAGSKVNTTGSVTSTECGTGATATATLTVVAPPVIAKSFLPAAVPLNGTSALSFTITNPAANAGPLNGVAFTDNLPAGLVVATPNGLTGSCVGGTVTAVAGSTTVSLAGATLAAAGSCTFSVNVSGTTPGVANNSVTVTSTNGGTGNTATAALTVARPPQITKSFGAATLPLNGSTTLSFTITNPAANPGSLNGVAFTDTLPAGMVVATPNGLTGSCGGGTIAAVAGSGTVSLTGATLTANGSCTFSVNVTGTTSGVKNNSVTVTSTNGGTGNTSNASLTVVAPPTIAKAFGAASVPLNGSTSLTFTLGNPNSLSLTGVGFTDTLPAGLVVSTPNGLSNTCGGTVTAVAGSNTVSLSGGTIAQAGNCALSVNVTGTSAGSKVNTTGSVTSTEGGTGATATATLTVVAPPVIAKSFLPAAVPLNGTSALSFTITNPAANAGPLNGVAFTDNLPAGLVVATPNGLTGSCVGGTVTAVAGSTTVSLAGATLAAAGSCTFSVNVTGTTPGVANNSVTVTSTNGGTGNTATAALTVASPPQITKSFGAATLPLNGSTTLSFTITNPAANPGSLNGVAFTDTLPAGMVVATPNGLTGSCGGGTIAAVAGSGTVSLTGATLTANGSCTFSVNVTGTTSGVKNNSVTVTSTNGGTGNTSNASLTVVAPPTIAKAFGAASVPLNGSTSLTFTLGNPNSLSLTGVGFTDTLPAGLVVSTPNGLSNTCGGTVTAVAGSNTVSLSGGTIAQAGNCALSVNVTGTSAGSKVNTTGSVTSTEGGTGATATATLTVVAPPVIAKSFLPAAVPLNGTSALSFTITNPAANAGPLNGVAFTDNLPAGLVVATPNGLTSSCGGTITAVAGSSAVSLAGATIAANATCTLSVNVTGTTPGAKNNSVTVSSTNGGTGNTATATVSVALPPQIAKAFGVATIPRNGSTTLSFTITNPNSSFALTGVGFTDTLPSGLVLSTPNGLMGSCGGGAITATAGSGAVSLANATLAGGASCTFSVNVTGTTSGVKNNSVTVTAGNAGTGNTATASITVLDPPAIAKAFGMASIPFGGSTTLTFTLTNPNTTVALTGVGFTDTLPAGLVVSTPNGLTGSCGGGVITATAGSGSVSLFGATIPANGSCTFAVNVTAVAVGDLVNTTSAVTSTNGGPGLPATATLTVTRAPTTTTVTATPTNPSLGSPVTFTATVVPSGPNNSGFNPTGTISFFLDGQGTPVAVVALDPATGMASFTTSGLGAGNHTVTAVYSGDTNFLPSSSTTSAMVTVTCTNTITGGHTGTLVLGPGSTCILGGTVSGSIVVPKGAALDLEGVTITGSITSMAGASFFRMCGSTTGGSVMVGGSTGFVLIGDPGDDGCATNTIHGSLTLTNNTAGVEAIDNFVAGGVTSSGNSGTGPFPEDTAPDISGNHP